MASTSPDRPAAGWFLALDGGIVALAALAFDGRTYAAARSRFPIPPRSVLRRMLAATAVIHVGEAAYAGSQARKRGLPVARWIVQTAVVGFPSLRLLRRHSA